MVGRMAGQMLWCGSLLFYHLYILTFSQLFSSILSSLHMIEQLRDDRPAGKVSSFMGQSSKLPTNFVQNLTNVSLFIFLLVEIPITIRTQVARIIQNNNINNNKHLAKGSLSPLEEGSDPIINEK